MSSETMTLLIGIGGMIFILVAFVLDEFFKTWQQNTLRYNVLNLVGSLLLLLYASAIDSWPFIILNLVWFATAGYKLVELMKK